MDINTPFISDPQMLESLLEDLNGEMEYSIMNDFLSKYTLQNDLYALKIIDKKFCSGYNAY